MSITSRPQVLLFAFVAIFPMGGAAHQLRPKAPTRHLVAFKTSSFLASSVGKESACNAGDPCSIPGLGRSPGEGKSYPLQYSSLKNSMDHIVRGVAKSRTPLSDFHFQDFTTSLYQILLWQPPTHSSFSGFSASSVVLGTWLKWLWLFVWPSGSPSRPSHPSSSMVCRSSNFCLKPFLPTLLVMMLFLWLSSGDSLGEPACLPPSSLLPELYIPDLQVQTKPVSLQGRDWVYGERRGLEGQRGHLWDRS